MSKVKMNFNLRNTQQWVSISSLEPGNMIVKWDSQQQKVDTQIYVITDKNETFVTIMPFGQFNSEPLGVPFNCPVCEVVAYDPDSPDSDVNT